MPPRLETVETYFCELCRLRLLPEQEVQEAAKLIEVPPGGRGTARQYLEGIRALFHPRHVPPGWRPKRRRRLGDFRSTAT